MRVKRYVVDSMPEALQRIRAELGKNAIILDTKPIRTGGFLGMFGKRRIEVIAADDEPSKMPVAATATAPSPSRTVQAAAASARPALATMPSAAPGTFPPVDRPASSRPAAMPDAVPDAVPAQFPPMDRPASSRQIPAAAQSSVPTGPDRERTQEDPLVREVKQMRAMLTRLAASAGEGEWPAAFQPVEERLREQDVLPSIIREVFEEALQQRSIPGHDWTVAEATASVRAVLLDMLTPNEPRTIKPDTKIVHFVGPTGVGKTTTIAKLAAEQALKHGRKIGFITSDTYRIAAIEQLRTYANILNVPLEVVFSPLEMSKAFQALEDRELIFMDTAGRNYRNEMVVSELSALLRAVGKSETFLVLSLAAKYRDMKAVIDNFSRISLDNVLYTKLDETDSYGSIINLAHEYGYRGTYVANGQNVPDDIEELDEHRLIDLIMGGVGDE